ncbi:MAG: ABC transporter substrate-binding protein [Marinibacterium sp.]|nr:ABC transporter substrate-binding protein [Marinibacterium sp.]
MTRTLFSRRSVLGFAGGLAATLAVAPQTVLALTQAGAKALVDKLVGDINRVISSGKSESAMIRDFEKIFRTYADVPIMARYTLGADARSATPQQLRTYTKAFEGYIATKYGRRFREFIGGRIEVKDARKIRNGWEIRSTAFLRGQSPYEVTFLVSDRSGKDKFYNLFIEGVNLLLTERTEIGTMLDQRGGDIDKLSRDLKKLA